MTLLFPLKRQMEILFVILSAPIIMPLSSALINMICLYIDEKASC